jgi:hypothetical protein
MRFLITLLFLFALSLPTLAVEREAFTITRYQLEAQLDRGTHVIAVSGKLTLRNDSKVPQKLVTLQVSSSLAWNGIALNGKPLEWIGDNYTSDIDHTGGLSEAIVTLPQATAPATAVTLDVQYGGTITPDATRLTRMGVPQNVAARNDWDEISEGFSAVRGLGYVVWYPVAIEAVSLSEGNSVFDAIATWKQRHRRSEFDARIILTVPATQPALCIATDAPGASCGESRRLAGIYHEGPAKEFSQTLHLDSLEETVPSFAIAKYVELARPSVTLLHVAEHTSLARDYALAAEGSDSLLHDWLPPASTPVRIIELTDPDASAWQDDAVLFTPLRQAPSARMQLLLLPAQVATRFHSSRPWIQEGMERFLQVMSVETRSGRQAALEYLDEYRGPLAKAEELAHAKEKASEADNTLLNSTDELYLRDKSSFVLWMLRDMLGDATMQRSLAAYGKGADNDPSYFQRVVQASAKRDLEWFFDDWVYRDRGLPDFHVDSVYPRLLLGEGEKNYLVTATVENRGRAGAEVPVAVQTPVGEKSARVLVKAGEKAVARIEVPAAPTKLVVNDGSVPEANTSNNAYNIPAQEQ